MWTERNTSEGARLYVYQPEEGAYLAVHVKTGVTEISFGYFSSQGEKASYSERAGYTAKILSPHTRSPYRAAHPTELQQLIGYTAAFMTSSPPWSQLECSRIRGILDWLHAAEKPQIPWKKDGKNFFLRFQSGEEFVLQFWPTSGIDLDILYIWGNHRERVIIKRDGCESEIREPCESMYRLCSSAQELVGIAKHVIQLESGHPDWNASQRRLVEAAVGYVREASSVSSSGEERLSPAKTLLDNKPSRNMDLMMTHVRNTLRQMHISVSVTKELIKSQLKSDNVLRRIRREIGGKPFVLFCGAGISIPSPSNAPGFLDILAGLVRAISELLTDRGVLQHEDAMRVHQAIHNLRYRRDLTFPPEMMFSLIQSALGNSILTDLIAVLDRGSPNANHRAVQELVDSRQLCGIITTNFDMYIERCLTNYTYCGPQHGKLPSASSIHIFKPHGSLHDPRSIAVTLSDVLVRPEDWKIQTLKNLLEDQLVVVTGYSGCDHDLLPILIEAGRSWNTRILWILYNEDSINVQVFKLQLALGKKLIVVNGRRRAVLPDLAGIDESDKQSAGGHTDMFFRSVFSACSTPELIDAFIGVADPIGVPEEVGVREKLLESLLQCVQSANKSLAAEKRLLYLLKIAHAENAEVRMKAIATGENLSQMHGLTDWCTQFKHVKSTDINSDSTLEAELKDIEFTHNSAFFPGSRYFREPKRTLRAMRFLDEIRKTEILLQLGDVNNAQNRAEEMLRKHSFPGSLTSRTAWLIEDCRCEAQVEEVLGQSHAKKGDRAGALYHYSRTLELAWRELDFQQLETTAESICGVMRRPDREIAELAISLPVEVYRLVKNPHKELDSLLCKFRYGFKHDWEYARATRSLDSLRNSIATEEYTELARCLGSFAEGD